MKFSQFAVLAGIISAMSITACVEDKVFPSGTPKPPPVDTSTTGFLPVDSIVAGSLVVNEFIAKGCSGTEPNCAISNYMATESENGKWFEIYNRHSKPIKLEAGKWFFSDSPTDPAKFMVSENGVNVPAKGYSIMFCDSKGNRTARGWHTSFSLSSTAESITIHYNKDATNTDTTKFLTVDFISYAAVGGEVEGYDGALSHISWGRLDNGGLPLKQCSTPTPGEKNR
jgi:hypothetical protein